MTRWLVGSFLIAHGLVHGAIWMAPKDPSQPAPFDPRHSWALEGIGIPTATVRMVSMVLALLATAAFLVAGGALLAHEPSFRGIAITAAAVSLALLATYYDPWLSFGIALDVAVIVAVVWLRWPALSALGA